MSNLPLGLRDDVSSAAPRSLRRNLLSTVFSAAVLLLSLLVCSSENALASHGRGGVLTWTSGAGNTVNFTFTSAWRRSFFAGPPIVTSVVNLGTFDFGDASSASLDATVNAVDAGNDIIFTTYTVSHTYASAGAYTAGYTNCCRISTLQDGNQDNQYTFRTNVTAGSGNSSPTTNFPPEIHVTQNSNPFTFSIPGTDPNGDNITYRLATSAESGLVTPNPSGFTITSAGLCSWNTTGLTVGNLYAVQVMIEDRDGNGDVKTTTPVDFIMEITANAGTPPYFVAPTPMPSGTTLNAYVGQNLSFDVVAVDNETNQTVTLESVSLPIGSSMSPSLPTTGSVGQPVSSTFSWTPNGGNAGNTYTITFSAEDNTSQQALHTIHIHVLTCNAAPTLTGQCPANITACGSQPLSWTEPTATDNCDVTRSTNHTPGETFNVGVTTVTYTFTNTASGTATCGFTVTIYPNPACSIVKTDLPDFCQGYAKLTAAVSNSGSLLGPLVYNWTGAGSGNGNVSSITALTNGTYNLSVTDGHGCVCNTSYSLNINPANVLSGYNLLANDEVHMHKSTVQGGGVGVRNANKKAKIHQSSTVSTFVKAPVIQVNGGSSVATQITGQANVALPTFVNNPYNVNTTTTVNQNQTVTLSGTNYGKVKIKKHANVTFSQSTIYLRSLETEEDVTISFTGDATMIVKDKVDLEDDNTFNAGAKRIIMYVGDEFEIEGGSNFTGNVYACDEIETKGHRDGSWHWDDDNCGGGNSQNTHTTMTGMFISKCKIKSGKNTDWYRGAACNMSSGFGARQSVAAADEEFQNLDLTSEDNSIVISPNPADRQAKLSLSGFEHETVTLKVFDNLGRLMFNRTIDANNSDLILDLSGSQYVNGMYTVQATSSTKQASRRLYINR